MSGLFAILNNYTFTPSFIKQQLGNIVEPNTIFVKSLIPKVEIAYQANDETKINQININDIYLYCDGQIYNSVELFKTMEIEPTTHYTWEIIIHLYAKYGIDYTLKVIDGIFSFILVDYRLSQSCSRIYVARDQYGVKPLYIMRPIEIVKNINNHERVENVFAFAKNLKTLNYFDLDHPHEQQKKYIIQQFTPGCYSVFEFPTYILASWNLIHDEIRYHTLCIYPNMSEYNYSFTDIVKGLRRALFEAIEKRFSKDKPLVCLLTGDLNSNFMATLLNDCCIKYKPAHQLETYSVGIQGSNNLKNAKLISDYLGTKHTEIILNEDDLTKTILKEAIPSVIYKIESYDPVLVEEGIYKWILSNYIKEQSDMSGAYVFCSEGLNELRGGSLNMDTFQTQFDYDNECDLLLGDIHHHVEMTVKSMDIEGIHLQFPFLDNNFVMSYLSIPLKLRFLWRKKNWNVLDSALSAILDEQGNIPRSTLFGKDDSNNNNDQETAKTMSSIIHDYIINNEDKEYLFGNANTEEENLYRHYYEQFFC